MTTLNITGSITTNDPISASYVAASNIDGVISSASYASTASAVLNAPMGGVNGMAYFTASTTWTIPNGITNIRVIAVGGGGGGSGQTNPHGAGGGGFVETVLSVSGYSTIPITVGNAGAGGDNSTNGTNGGSSGLLSVTASGGSGATPSSNGGGGNGNGATLIVSGQSGDTSNGGCAGNYPWVAFTEPGVQSGNELGHGGYGFHGNGNKGMVVIYY